MKNLANCKPTEFVKQTSRIKHHVEKWLKITDIMNIRKNVPKYDADATEEERANSAYEYGKRNLSKVFDVIFDEHPTETLELLALCCFVEPENVDDYVMDDYLGAIYELLASKNVMNFFMLLVKLAHTNIFKG